MTLSASEAAHVQSMFAKVTPQASTLGSEVLERLFLNFPQTKTHFAQYDLSHGSADLLSLGGKMFNALGNAANHLDDLANNLSALSELPVHDLFVDPRYAELLSHTIQVVLAVHFPEDFTTETQSALDKFLSEVSTVLASKTG